MKNIWYTAMAMSLVLLFFWVALSNAQNAQVNAQGSKSIEAILNADGTLDTSPGNRSESYSCDGYVMTTDSVTKAPRFMKGNGVAKEQVITWSNAGGTSSTDNTIRALAVDGSGNVYAGGSFTSIVGVSANRIAKWDGSSWSALGSGMDGSVYAVACNGNDVYAGGWFSTAGGSTVNYIAKWNGSSWSALGSGMNGYVYSIACSGSNVYVGGAFTLAGGVAATNIAKWDGSSFSRLEFGLQGDVYAIACNGSTVYACGSFTTADWMPANYIAKWNGSSWSALGTGLNNTAYAIALNGSDVYVGGSFTTAGGSSANRIAKWDGSSWSALQSGVNSVVNGIACSGSDMYACGDFSAANGSSANYTAKWNGSSWSALGNGVDASAKALVVRTSEGKIYVGGTFSTANGSVTASKIARFSDSENPLPVELTSFTTTIINSHVRLNWSTATEINNYGFEIERRVVLAKDWQTIGFVKGSGTTNTPRSYSFDDNPTLPSQLYQYRLKQLDRDGAIHYSHHIEVDLRAVKDFSLEQNYPNPFGSARQENVFTKITFSLPSQTHTKVIVTDVLGREVRTLVNDVLEAGRHQITFRASDMRSMQKLASGVYYYTLATPERSMTKKMMVVN